MFSIFQRKKIGCPFCLQKDAIEIHLTEEERRTFPLPSHILKNKKNTLIKVSLYINWIVIYSCSKCHTSFNAIGAYWTKVSEAQKEVLKRWEHTSSQIPKEIEAEFERIGFSKWGDDAILPCKINTINGEEIDFVTVQYCAEFPKFLVFGDMFVYQRYFFIEDIQRIEASKYAVSKEVRNEAMNNQEEVEKNFFPTIVANQNGMEFLFEGLTLFMNHPEAIGSELHLSENKWQKRKQYINDYTPQRQHLVILKKGK